MQILRFLDGLDTKNTFTKVIQGLTMLIWLTGSEQIPLKAPEMKIWHEHRPASDNILSTDEQMIYSKWKSDYHNDGLYSVAKQINK